MSDLPEAKPGLGFLKWAVSGVALFGLAAVLYIIAQAATKPAPVVHTGPVATSAAAAAAAAVPAGFASKLDHANDGKPATDYVFKDVDGKPVKVGDLKGKVVVMNMWASWCGPCKIEMPTLAKLQAAYAGQPVEVVAISIDKPEAIGEAKAFLAKQAPLKFYNDPDAKMPWAIKPSAQGIPTTVIYGKDGLERGRVNGDADWSGVGAKAAIDKALAG
jgi:thiol-disulfide isomerase/thioredoxin